MVPIPEPDEWGVEGDGEESPRAVADPSGLYFLGLPRFFFTCSSWPPSLPC
jgi:hypothetical protein